jgi:hypothetical protein
MVRFFIGGNLIKNYLHKGRSSVLPNPPAVALGVPARDPQIILGHSRLAATLEIYTRTDDQAQLDTLTRLQDLFNDDEDDEAGN